MSDGAAPASGAADPPVPRVTPRGLARAALNLARATFVAATAVSFFVLWFFNPQAGRFVFVLMPLLAVTTYSRARAALVPWAIYVVGFLIFVDLRMISAELLFPARFEYAIGLERLLFFGHIPSLVLQNALYVLGRPSPFDLALIGVHFSFFLIPHVVAIWIWIARPALFARYTGALVATCWAALVIAFLLPTAPPWLAAAQERIPHVYRIVQDVLSHASPESYSRGLRAVGENDAAAMPSLHTALTVLVALACTRMHAVAAVAGWLYAAAMALALVYLGEHYVVDILAGALTAIFFWRILARTERAPETRLSAAPVASEYEPAALR
ncbi:MAG TPA: phosphatase PAP2 family protein [Longimicrobiales bacterium]